MVRNTSLCAAHMLESYAPRAGFRPLGPIAAGSADRAPRPPPAAVEIGPRGVHVAHARTRVLGEVQAGR